MVKKNKKEKNIKKEESLFESDEHHYFIAGYTSGGASYGITWEEAEAEGLLDDKHKHIDSEKEQLKIEAYDTDEDLPF